MIIKSYEVKKLNLEKNHLFLMYGENEGLKNEVINDYFYNKYSKNYFKYEEQEIIKNKENFFNNIFNKSFFEKKKIIIISRVSDKILEIIEKIIENKIQDIKVIINAGNLDTKSKLRKFFEKSKENICIPFYADNLQNLSSIAINFFYTKKIPISQQIINLIIERCRGDRQNLTNELNKIENFTLNKKNITIDEILKLTNLAENYSVSELIDNCLAKNSKKITNILNENNYSLEDCVLITRTLLIKAKRLHKIKNEISNNKKIDHIISSFKPPIFWKDKEIVKQQVKSWTTAKIENLIYDTNQLEFLIKKNSINSVNILSDFIINSSNN